MPKMRLDLLLVEQGLVESRAKAQVLIMAGQVRVEGEVVLKAGASVATTSRLEVERGQRYVSRGGEKLAAALEEYAMNVAGRLCADVGASTGGFTDCLLQRGAAKVYAIDVGKGNLHWKLRNDPRVTVMERTNARFLTSLAEPVSLVTIDASFISLRLLLPVVKAWFSVVPPLPSDKAMMHGALGDVIALIKPQFEAGKKDVSRGAGVIRNPDVHRQVLVDVLNFAQSKGMGVRGLIRSPLKGPKGNAEFLVWLGISNQAVEIDNLIEGVVSLPARAGN